MTECESFEVEIEIRQHGTLEPARAEAVERHLEGCPSCRRYEALVRQTERTMEAQAEALDLHALDARVGRIHRELRLRFWIPVAILSALTISLCVVTGSPAPVLLAMGTAAALVFGLFWLRVTREAREIARAGREQSEFLALYRRLLVRRVRVIKVVTALMPVFMLESLVQWRLGLWPVSQRPAAAYAAVALVQAAAFVWLLFLRLRRVPQMKRELQELGDG